MVKISSKSVNKQPNYRYPKKILKFGKTNEKQSFFQACKLKMTKQTHFSQAVFGHFEKILKPGNKKSQNKLSKSFKTQEFSIQNSFFLLKVLNLIDLAEKLAQTEAKLNLMSKFKEFFGGKFVNSRSFQKNLWNIKKNFRNFQKTHSKNSHAFLPKVKVLLAS